MCGNCCKLYSVVIDFQEWFRIVKNYGVEQTASGLDKFFIKRTTDGACIFLRSLSNTYFCGLQHMKPKACKLWPFRILDKPRYGNSNQAVFSYGQNRFFVYVDSSCNGIRYGAPTRNFANNVLAEFVEIAAGIREIQHQTTSNISLRLNGFYPQCSHLRRGF
jgi:Fe-S-cluster containining protein